MTDSTHSYNSPGNCYFVLGTKRECGLIGVITYSEELSSVLIAIVNSNGSSTNAYVEANSEFIWAQRQSGAILLEDDLSLEESALGSSTVDLLGLSDHNRSVFEEVVNYEFSESVVFKSAFDHAFLEIAQKSKHLYNK